MQRSSIVILAVLAVLACSKSNSVEVGGQPSVQCTGDEACQGACVEGVCRAFCDANYGCPSPDTCVAVGSGAVCLPPGERTYPPYQPADLLSDWQAPQGCEIGLDAPMLEGVFEQCLSSGHHVATALADNFDLAGACAKVDSYVDLFVKGRVAWRVIEQGACTQSRVGQAQPGSLVEFCFSAGESGAYIEIGRVVERDGSLYLLKSGYGMGAEVIIYKFQSGTVADPPSTCSAPDGCASLPEFPFIGEAASQYAGLWMQCDSESDCTGTWDQPALNDTRQMLYIRHDGIGGLTTKTGDAHNPVPTSCNTAFRRTSLGHVLFIERYDSPVSTLRVARYATTLEQEYLTTEFRLLSGGSAGSSWPLKYKKVPPPLDFKDPCDGAQPLTKF